VIFDIVTIFPEFFQGPFEHGIIRRTREDGLIDIRIHDLRNYTADKHRTVDDRPFGGGEGMVLKPEPIFEAVESLPGKEGAEKGIGETRSAGSPQNLPGQAGQAPALQKTAVVLLSASGKLFRQETARRYAALDRVVLICGRYEGVDERVAEHLATEELSIGDFVLSGGELPAALVVDAVTRLLPGALGNEASALQESFSEPVGSAVGAQHLSRAKSRDSAPLPARPDPVLQPSPLGTGILDYPHYTRPADFRGWAVPDVLLGGNHAEIRRWRRKMALAKTLRNRPDLLASASLSDDDLRLLDEIQGKA